MEEFMIVDISSIISLLTKIDPIKACSASRLEGCLSFMFFDRDIFSTKQ